MTQPLGRVRMKRIEYLANQKGQTSEVENKFVRFSGLKFSEAGGRRMGGGGFWINSTVRCHSKKTKFPILLQHKIESFDSELYEQDIDKVDYDRAWTMFGSLANVENSMIIYRYTWKRMCCF